MRGAALSCKQRGQMRLQTKSSSTTKRLAAGALGHVQAVGLRVCISAPINLEVIPMEAAQWLGIECIDAGCHQYGRINRQNDNAYTLHAAHALAAGRQRRPDCACMCSSVIWNHHLTSFAELLRSIQAT